ncbi:AAA family ATPase [Hydrogenimonas thermophila]|uniref:DUF3696 domain-containing protein n=1 Tax=Hydrogenimonas thermophila TaxID=223786 RepID=UPI0029370AE3|nr:AAA family ATPase [Hydrogenimonas thermophila]WOE68755.1 AAA family ATPase [Hydrogenimonas thermophila]WOE71265.1 AAA family ATPase [Hydrogenimonas thermophila]
MQIRIQNFRSLKDTGFIDIKPITILVGKNSSGKSSFLRTFPMLKQSVEENTRTPLLFYGRYVDFGSFKDIKPSFGTEEEKYILSFKLDISHRFIRVFRPRIFFMQKKLAEIFINSSVLFSVNFEEDKNLIHPSHYHIEFLNNKIDLSLDFKKKKVLKIIVNDNVIDLKDQIRFIEKGELIPAFYSDENKDFFITNSLERYIEKRIMEFIKKFNRKNTSVWTIEEIASNIDINDFINSLIKESYPKTWVKNVKKWIDSNDDKLLELKELYMLNILFSILLPSLNEALKIIFKNSSYIAPLRATAERFYRIQHLAVNEVDPNGKNLPFFLDSLTKIQMTNFQTWTQENFGFKVDISKSEGHYSIKIVQNNQEINLSDMGFGYSQILPIIVQLWYSSSGYEFRHKGERIKEKIIVIEQPELHLHPEFQSKFAEVLVKIIKYSKEIKLIIETHSDTLINRLGDCIAYNKLDPNDVNIIIFNKDDKTSITKIEKANFNKDGDLENWPLGFFLASDIGC